MSRFARCSNRKAGLDFTFFDPFCCFYLSAYSFPDVSRRGILYGAQGKAQEETLRSLQENLHTLNLGGKTLGNFKATFDHAAK